ncbi:isoleucine--tRNA ligase [Lentisphaera profundi]|uniref:Isoleucine--tRNA ligase n=1 Tax=Lentisphaera profundi TaxID=1658616 RepID=A0ABY7VVZ5_9BACT|nr:isoleucine--tRNA ligase [Lentisphaera profundi]WDE98252.1 isoleucine--tRNA ligase [Lentisphaera profundi]
MENENQHENFSFVESEKKILDFWTEKEIFKKSLEQTKDCPPYIFYDGPPFATGLPHHGHLVASTLKDIIPRYFTMKGRYVERRFGWDCHGLPIEHEIDKKLGMSAQDAVEKIGVKAYNQECRGIVQRFTSEWEKTISRIGRWVDFENDYKTMDTDFMESVWWIFGQLWEKGLIYQGTKVVPFSTALGTVLSNFEAGSNYQDVQDPAVTIFFKLQDEDAYLAAWTTTPWTLPSNLCLCTNAAISYVKVRDEESQKVFYMAEARLEHYRKKNSLEILETVTGADLKGRKYEPLFPYFAELAEENCFQILNDDYVTTESGTGIVHLAPGFGEDDNRVMQEADIKATVCPVDDAGKFTSKVTDYAAVYVKDADKEIIKDLKERGRLYERSSYLHSYPFCPRSKTPLIYKSIPSWYVNVEAVKDKMIAANKQIHWVPEHIKEGRFGKWLEGARDWAISRNRVWGTPMPIWINDTTDNRICISSIEQLKELSGIELSDLHREHTDEVHFTIPGEEGTYKRITEVFDCWFESGSMPYAQLHYPFENKEVFDAGFPAEFIAEGLDQTRGWFYTLTVLSAAIFDKPAFKNVIVNGLVLAKDGRKMSKSERNFTAPDSLMEDFGADALRLYLITSGLVRGEEQKFDDKGVKDMVRTALLPWFNSFKFFKTYADLDGWDPAKHYVEGDNITDNWLISNLQTLKKNISTEMDAYQLYNVVPALFTFIEDLTNTYIRLNRGRFWAEGLEEDKCAAYSTLYTALNELSISMAPFAPFFSEFIFQELKSMDSNSSAPESVHLCDYPTADESKINSILEDAVDRMNQIILLGRQKRNQVKIKVKTPLQCLTVIHKDKDLLQEISRLENYLKTELNIKSVAYDQDEAKYINFFTKPNFPALGKRLGKQMGKFTGMIKKLSEADIANFERDGSIELGGEVFTQGDIDIFREAREGHDALSNSLISIELDCNLSPELLREGLAREVVNRIQRSRKEAGFNVGDRIALNVKSDPNLQLAIEEHLEYICGETLTDSISFVIVESYDFEFKIEDYALEIGLLKA